jgi:TorA maturation chaperone TorD
MCAPANKAEEWYRESLWRASLLFGLIGNALSTEPNKNILRTFLDRELFSQVPYAEDEPSTGKGLHYLRIWQKQSTNENNEDILRHLQGEWFRCFVGAGKPVASPWQSCYTDKDFILFSEDTFKVRTWYRKYGLQVKKLNNEPDDHIGIMLNFLAHLTDRESRLLSEGALDVVEQLQKDQLEFLNKHILTFLSTWCDLVISKSYSNFYTGLALLARGAVNARFSQLDAIIYQ